MGLLTPFIWSKLLNSLIVYNKLKTEIVSFIHWKIRVKSHNKVVKTKDMTSYNCTDTHHNESDLIQL